MSTDNHPSPPHSAMHRPPSRGSATPRRRPGSAAAHGMAVAAPTVSLGPDGTLVHSTLHMQPVVPQPYQMRWQAAAEYKIVKTAAELEAARKGSLDYLNVNAKLIAQQLQQAEAEQLAQQRAAEEREAERARLEQEEAEELMRLEQERLDKLRKAREAEEAEEKLRQAERREATMARRRNQAAAASLRPAAPSASAAAASSSFAVPAPVARVSSHKRNPTPIIPLNVMAPQRAARRAPMGGSLLAEEEDEIAEEGADDDPKRGGGGETASQRRARMLRLDGEDEQDEGADLVIPEDGEVEEDENQPDLPVTELNVTVASVNEDEEEEAEMMERIDQTLSRALHEQSQSGTTTGPQKRVNVAEFVARPRHARMDSMHPYHKVEVARQQLETASKLELALENEALAKNGFVVTPAAKAIAASAKAKAKVGALQSPSFAEPTAPSSSSPSVDSTAAAAAAVAAASSVPIPPATLRMFPPALVSEVEEAHKLLGHFINKCNQATRDIKERTGSKPIELIDVYLSNFVQMLSAAGLDSDGYPLMIPDSSPHAGGIFRDGWDDEGGEAASTPASSSARGSGVRSPIGISRPSSALSGGKRSSIIGSLGAVGASTLAAAAATTLPGGGIGGSGGGGTAVSLVPPAHVTLCASYLLVKICESGIFSSYGSQLLMTLLNTLLFGVFDTSYESAGVGTGPKVKRTPFFTRLKHLHLAHADVQRYKDVTESRLRSNLNSLRMVIRHSQRRFLHLAFRAWKHEVKLARKRSQMQQLSLRRREEQPTVDTDLVSVFFYWRAFARSAKLERLLGGELQKLGSILAAVRSESHKATESNSDLAEHVHLLALRLEKLEAQKLTNPLKPDPFFAPAFIELLFERSARELEACTELTTGFVPLFKLAPRHAKKLLLARMAEGVAPINHAPNVAQAVTQANQGAGFDFCARTDALIKQLSTLSRSGNWSSRQLLFDLITAQRATEDLEESKNEHELLLMDPELFVVNWANFILGHNPLSHNAPKNEAAAASGGAPKENRKLRDLSTDLRDSQLYTQLLSALGPELPTNKVDKLFDLHSKAKLILSLSAMLGVRLPLNEFEFVEGKPDLHLLLLTGMFTKRQGMVLEPKRSLFAHKTHRIAVLRDHWSYVSRMDHVPPVTAYSFLGHLYQFSLEVSVLRARLLRRQSFMAKIQSKLANFMWTVHRARLTGLETEYYQPKHINSQYHHYIESGTIESILARDPVRLKARLKYEGKQLGKTAAALAKERPDGAPHVTGTLSKKERHQLVLDDESEVSHEISEIKRLFSNHRVELKKIQKHYSTDPASNHLRQGVDLEAFQQFARDCGFVAGGVPATNVLLDDAAQSHMQQQAEKLQPQEVTLIFQQCLGRSGATDAAADLAASSPSSALTPSQFLDGCIRLSHSKYAGVLPGSLSSRVQRALERDILTGACRTVVDEFRKSVASESVRAVFKANKGKLSALFRRYSTADLRPVGALLSVSSEHSFTMSFPQFLALLTDVRLVCGVGGILSESRLRVLFQNVQQDEDYGSNESGAAEELSYVEWLEALAALACWCRPDPFMPLATKLESFLTDTIFATLKRSTAPASQYK